MSIKIPKLELITLLLSISNSQSRILAVLLSTSSEYKRKYFAHVRFSLHTLTVYTTCLKPTLPHVLKVIT